MAKEYKDISFAVKCKTSKEAFEILRNLLKKGKVNFVIASENSIGKEIYIEKLLKKKKGK